jgi:hypothetical protein
VVRDDDRGEEVTRGGFIAAVAALCVASACQGSTGGSTPAPASGNVATGAPQTTPPTALAASNGTEPTQAAPGASAPTAASAPAGAPGTVTVDQALKTAGGAHAVVRGVYLGWAGPCRSQPPTRSAWQLADGTDPSAACIYVDGPSPAGLAPAGPPPTPPGWVRGDAEIVAAGPDKFLASRMAEREP